jgi:hypothetical protein
MHRSEHWIVVEGTAEVTIGDTVRLVTENEGVYIPLGAKHRMANRGKLPMYLIEVQTGSYLGEDDILRYEDAYNRPEREGGLNAPLRARCAMARALVAVGVRLVPGPGGGDRVLDRGDSAAPSRAGS